MVGLKPLSPTIINPQYLHTNLIYLFFQRVDPLQASPTIPIVALLHILIFELIFLFDFIIMVILIDGVLHQLYLLCKELILLIH